MYFINMLFVFHIGEQQVINVPNELIEKLAGVRFSFAKLIYDYEKELQNSPEAQKNLVEFLPRFCKGKSGSFKSLFDTPLSLTLTT